MRARTALWALAVLSLPLARAWAEEPFVLPVATGTPHVAFSSDHFDYEKSSSTAHLSGHVVMRQATATVRTEELWMDLERKKARASGFVEMDDGRILMYGSSGDFDLENGTGVLEEASADFKPWRIRGASARRLPDKDVVFRRAWFTSCNLDVNPHYHLAATSVRVRPQKWIYSWNNVLFLGRVPVLYAPFLWRSLESRPRLRTQFFFGDDHRNGKNVQTRTYVSLAPNVLGKIFLDFYDLQGPGAGGELQYHQSDGQGALYGYRIQERQTSLTRWTLQGDDYQPLSGLGAGSAFQMRLQTQSDPSLGNDYSRFSSFRVAPELINGAALVQNRPWGTLRISYSRHDEANLLTQKFFKTDEVLPRLDFNSAAFHVPGLPWLNTFSGFAENEYAQGVGYLQRTVGSQWSASRTLLWSRRWSFVPAASVGETYQNQISSGMPSVATVLDAFTTRYSGTATLRYRSLIGDWDLAQSYVRRSRPNSLTADVLANDRGIESNQTTLTDSLYLRRGVWMRAFSGFTYQTFRANALRLHDRILPVTADVNWQPRPRVSLLARDQYSPSLGNQTAVFQADWGQKGDNRFLGVGFEHTLSSGSVYVASQEFAWKPSSGTWSAGGAIRSVLNSLGGLNFNTFAVFEKELWIKKDFHDFRSQILFRTRPGGVKEVVFNIQLRLDTERPVENLEKAPWRQWKAEGP